MQQVSTNKFLHTSRNIKSVQGGGGGGKSNIEQMGADVNSRVGGE